MNSIAAPKQRKVAWSLGSAPDADAAPTAGRERRPCCLSRLAAHTCSLRHRLQLPCQLSAHHSQASTAAPRPAHLSRASSTAFSRRATSPRSHSMRSTLAPPPLGVTRARLPPIRTACSADSSCAMRASQRRISRSVSRKLNTGTTWGRGEGRGRGG
jgi:hypothetical protein